jgi:hypothetical protein
MREHLWPGAYIVRVVIPLETRSASHNEGWLEDGDYPAVAIEFPNQTITQTGLVWVLTNRGLEYMKLSNALVNIEDKYSVRLLLKESYANPGR